MMSNLLTIGETISNLLFARWDNYLLINAIIHDDWWRKFEKKIRIDLEKRLSYVLQLRSIDKWDIAYVMHLRSWKNELRKEM